MLKVAFIHALKYMVFCIGNLDITVRLDRFIGTYRTTSPEGDFLAFTYFTTIIDGSRK